MGRIKGYFKNEFQVNMFGLKLENASDFYVTCFQRNRSVVPLLCIRTIVFLGCIGILLSSLILTGRAFHISYWFTYLTHWGLILITLTSGFGFAVSVRALLKGTVEQAFGLPWLVKIYWVFYNVTLPIAFFITVFYWIFLTEMAEEGEFAISPTLDVFIHLVNSLLMLVLLITARHTSRLLHFYQPVLTTIIYLIFSMIYYFAGGLSPLGEVYIYPMLDWSDPATLAGTAVGSAISLVVLHSVVVAVAVARNKITKRFHSNSRSISIANDLYN